MKKLFLLLLILLLILFFVTPLSRSTPSGQEAAYLLTREYDFSLKLRAGDVDYFRIKTVYYHGNALGILQNRDEIIGSFKREVLKVTPGSLVARYSWKNVRIGHSPKPYAEITDWKALAFADGFAYEMDLFSPDFLSTVGIERIDKTMDGMRFWVNIMDAHAQPELLLTEAHGNISRIKKIGDQVTVPDAHQSMAIDLPPFVTESLFTNGGYETSFVGIGVVDGRPCAVLEYINTDSELRFKIRMNPKLIFNQRGTSNFWGHVYVDTASGKLLRSDLHEYVVVLIEGSALGEPMRLFERRHITVEKITEDRF